MDARSKRWTEVTPSAFAHEAAALSQVRQLLPDSYPYAAWSNFSFVSTNGAIREVDLLVMTLTGPVVVEIKDWHGELTTRRGSGVWLSRQGSDERPRDNPLILANQKAKELKSLIERAVRRDPRHRDLPRLPYFRAAVFFSNPTMSCTLPDEDRHHLYGPPVSASPAGRTGAPPLPDITTLLTGSTTEQVNSHVARYFAELVVLAGISRTRASMHVGPWQLDPRPFDEGPTWQDYHATHQSMPNEYSRVRIYLTAKGGDAETQRSIREVAEREFAATRGITHPAILAPAELAQHEAGPALVLGHRREAQRLDQYMATHGRALGLGQRVDLVRQIAEAVRYAHSRSLVHRALSARAILVEPTDGEWSRPQPLIGDWQVASRGRVGGTHVVEVTMNAGRHLDPASSPYLAPEFREGTEGAVSLDVYGLGTLAYLILTGQPPAADQAGVLQQLRAGTGLHPAALDAAVPDDLDAIVALATAPEVSDRIDSTDDFLELLSTALPSVVTGPRAEPAVDPLDVLAGEEMPDGTGVEAVLGTGSSARAFLVDHDGVKSVYKVARSEAAEERLEAEYDALDGLRHENIAGVRRGLFTLGSRSAIEVDFAGRHSVARRLRQEGEFLPDQLDRFGRQLIDAVAYLEKENVFHRDIKPDNIGVFEPAHKQRARLVLFDFSLAAVPLRRLDAGTRGYLDPWLGEPRRPEFDAPAERYAAAATLHEMASLLVPEVSEGPPGRQVTVASDLFAAPLRAPLTRFFSRAFDPDTDRRFDSAASMGRAWSRVFAEVDQTLPATTTGNDARALDDARQGAADRVRPETPLDAAGLSPRAVTVAQRLGAQTVNDLVLLNNRTLWTARGLSRATRTELVQRRGQWRIDFDLARTRPGAADTPPPTLSTPAPQTSAGRDDASVTLVGVDPLQYPLDVLVERLVPVVKARSNTRVVEFTRSLLGLTSLALPTRAPDAADAVATADHTGRPAAAPRWPTNREVADALGVTPGRVSQIAMQARAHWAADEVLAAVVTETVGILDELGRVAEVDEVAGQLLLRHGSTQTARDTRMAQARAVLRAVIGRSDDEVRQRRVGRHVLLALEVTDDDSPDTPSAPGLLDVAAALGVAADRLATQDPLPAPATVVRTLQGPAAQAGLMVSESRLVGLAAAASDGALAGPRLELYPRDLSPVRALRLAQAGAGLPPGGLSTEQVRERASARLPGLPELPDGQPLLDLLREAGFLVRADGDRIVPQTAPVTAIVDPVRTATSLGSSATGTTAGSAEDVDAPRVGDADDRLRHAREAGGFRAVTARLSRLPRTREHVGELLGVPAVDATRAFLDGVRRVAVEWEIADLSVVFDADASAPDSPDARMLSDLVGEVLTGLRTAWLGVDAPAVLLLDNLTPLGRYDPTLRLVVDLAERARRGGRDGNPRTVVLLCAATDARRPPRIGGQPVVLLGREEWVVADPGWGTGVEPRAAVAASGGAA